MGQDLTHNPGPDSEILIYTTDDGNIRIDVQMVDETVWLNQAQMAELFGKARTTITEHIRNVFEEGELVEGSVCRNFRHTASDGKNYEVQYYSLDVIISVGYRVKSHLGTQFRQWATGRLREYIIKGFTLDDKRLREGRTATDYFDELIDRIRDIRASERNFYQKIKDIYRDCSIDYDPHAETSQQFYQKVQNKLHWAVHGQTAAELIAIRANAGKPYMGLTSFKGDKPRKTDATIAKNYLNEEEISLLNLLVNQYLDFAELQAKRRQQMTMRDWVSKLDDFLKLNDMEILEGLGKTSKQAADEMARLEFGKYKDEQKRIGDQASADALEREARKLIESTSIGKKNSSRKKSGGEHEDKI